MMFRRLLGIGVVVAALLALSAMGVSAASGPSDIGKALPLTVAPAQGTLAPGQSAWFKFNVPQEYTVEQMKRDQRDGLTIGTQQILLQFSDASNPDVAHNTGFRLYDPETASLVMDDALPPVAVNAEGMARHDNAGNPIYDQAWWAIGSPNIDYSTEKARDELVGVDAFIGHPKLWQGVLHDAGTYYVQVYNESGFPMTYSLSISGPDLTLGRSV